MRDKLIHSALGLLLAGCLVGGSWLLFGPSDVSATPAPPSDATTQATDPLAGVSYDAGTQQSATTATIVFSTVPMVTANVSWGRKLLGKIKPGKPLVVVRPRDSGPLDVMVRAPGYLSVQTRAHTFSDNRVLVKLTPPDKKNELVGYRIPIDAGADGAVPEAGVWGDAGVPDAAVMLQPLQPISAVRSTSADGGWF